MLRGQAEDAALLKPDIQAFFDEVTNTASYLVSAPGSDECLIIDPVLDYDSATGRVGTTSADRMLDFADAKNLRVNAVLETHVHADHLSAAAYIRGRTGAWIGIGHGILKVQYKFAPTFGALDMRGDGKDFDRLLDDGERFQVGSLDVEVIATPGHTPACVSYRIGDAVFTGDTLFMPDYGTARCDFPGGDARQLYRSIARLLALPPETRLFLCHDYKAPGRDAFAWETTVAEQRRANVHVGEGRSEDDYVAMREARDAGLSAPKLIIPSIQVNIRAGRLPPAEPDGRRYLRVPLKLPDGLPLD